MRWMLSTGNQSFSAGPLKNAVLSSADRDHWFAVCAEMSRPFTGGVKHTQHLHQVAAYTVWNDVWSARHDQFAGSGHSSGPACGGKSLQILYRFYDRGHRSGRSLGIVR